MGFGLLVSSGGKVFFPRNHAKDPCSLRNPGWKHYRQYPKKRVVLKVQLQDWRIADAVGKTPVRQVLPRVSGKGLGPWWAAGRLGLVFGQWHVFVVVVGRQVDASLFPVFFCLFDAFFARGNKVPPNIAVA